jgi:hypothetical protein
VNVAKSHIDPEASEPLVPRRWAHATVSASMHCRNCGYDLRGLDASSRCPECGMDVWATVVHTIDPASSRLPSIRNPVAVGNSLLVLTVCLLIGGLLMAMPFVATAMESARSGSAAPGNANVWWRQLPQFNWPYALVLGLTGVWAIWTLAPPRGAEPGGPVWDDIWRYEAAARELRDRYLEQVNADRLLPAANGKYDVSRQVESASSTLKQTPLLEAA